MSRPRGGGPPRGGRKRPVRPAPEERPSGGTEEAAVELEGEVTEALPATTFRVKLDTGQEVLAHLSGRLRKFRIRVNPGDRVRVEVSPYDLTRGRISYRL